MRTSLLLLLSTLALAHSGGHGPKVPGLGPKGGERVAIVAAAEADLGEKAQSQGTAEWIRHGDELEVYLPAAVSGELKWIAVGGSLAKPVVIKTVAAGTVLKYTFEARVLDQAETVEAILPSLGERAGKHVLAIPLR